MITSKDDFLTIEENKFVFDYCLSAKFCHGETTSSNGMISEIFEEEDIYQLFKNKIEKYSEGLKIYWMYVNSYLPGENPYFRRDTKENADRVFTYYPQQKWELDDGGTTEFYVDNGIVGVFPIPNRLLYFDADIPHRTNSFRDRFKFTVELRCNIESL